MSVPPFNAKADADVSAASEPSKEDVMDYVFAMLAQLAELSARCGEKAIAQTLQTLVAGHDHRNGGSAS